MTWIKLSARTPAAVEDALYSYRKWRFALRHQSTEEIEAVAAQSGYSADQLRQWVKIIDFVRESLGEEDANRALAFDMFYGLKKAPYAQPRRKVAEIQAATHFSEATIYKIRQSGAMMVQINAGAMGLLEKEAR